MSFNYLSTARKSKRSQSALEYMMTYGWAILIIVIVAVILYSMGIFNPSSSITFTSSGFSPFTVSSSLCNNIGYKIAVLAGPIPNNANSITINKVFLTSATGANTTTASYTLTNPVTLKSGQSATILIPNVACNSANIHYSLSAKIQYSYDVPTIGLQTVNTTGTVAGTSITGKPSTLTSYEPITITNSQSSATPSPFQQMINFTSSDPGFSSIATGNFGQNVEFFYYNGTIIPSWLENYTSTNGLWWLKIAAISGGSSQTIYVGFAPTSTSLFNTVNDGEAPQIPCGSTPTSSCSNYAEYDDGANVFELYDNFAGTTLNTTEWSEQLPSGYTITQDNNINMSTGATRWGGLVSIRSFTAPVVTEADVIAKPSSASVPAVGLAEQIGPAEYSLGYDVTYWAFSRGNMNGGMTAIAPEVATTGVIGLAWAATGNEYEYQNYSVLQHSTNSSISLPSKVYASFGSYCCNVNYLTLQWVRIRAYPPSGIMPSVTFGSVV